jgi:hypothetical protein
MIEQSFKEWLILEGPKFSKNTAISYITRLRRLSKYYNIDLSSKGETELQDILKMTYTSPLENTSPKIRTDIRSALKKYFIFKGYKRQPDIYTKFIEKSFKDWLVKKKKIPAKSSISYLSRLNQICNLFNTDISKLKPKDLESLIMSKLNSPSKKIPLNQLSNLKTSLKYYIQFKNDQI